MRPCIVPGYNAIAAREPQSIVGAGPERMPRFDASGRARKSGNGTAKSAARLLNATVRPAKRDNLTRFTVAPRIASYSVSVN